MSHVDDFSWKVFGCVSCWMRSIRLQVNPEKTELFWCSSSRRQHRLPTTTLTIGSTTVALVFFVHDLRRLRPGDAHSCVSDGVALFRSAASARSIRHLVSATVFQSLVAALVLSRLDHGNGTLVFQPISPVDFSWFRMQRQGSFSGSVVPTSAGKDHLHGRRADLLGAARWCSVLPLTVQLHR